VNSRCVAQTRMWVGSGQRMVASLGGVKELLGSFPLRLLGFLSTGVLTLISLIASPVLGEVCDQYEFGDTGEQVSIYSEGKSWDLFIGSDVGNALMEVQSVLATSTEGVFHLQVRVNGSFVTEWSHRVSSSGFTLHSYSEELNLPLYQGDKLTYFIYADPDNASVGGIRLPGSIRLCHVPPGDIDRSGSVGLGDAITGMKILAGMEPAGVHAIADVNGDDILGTDEIVYILQILSGYRTSE
jgi:hypothetical protein